MTQNTPAGTQYHLATIGSLTERGGRVTTAIGGARHCTRPCMFDERFVLQDGNGTQNISTHSGKKQEV